MSALAATFRELSEFESSVPYELLPFRFLRLDRGRYVATNAAGQHVVLSDATLRALVEHRLIPQAGDYRNLEARHFLSTSGRETHLELLAAQYRTRQSILPELAELHLFVVTLRCDHTCQYCQVSRVSEDRQAFDMSEATADRAIELVLRSPATELKIEFQGGESLLNFPLIRHIVLRSKARAAGRRLHFVVATNLSPLTDEMLDFFAEHRVFVSTSLDGPPVLHNRNRPRPGQDAHRRTIEGIERCRSRLGPDAVSALMTCTAESLSQPEAIIDEYAARGFREVFLRYISPYGFAVRSARKIGYETEQFLDFYRRGLAHILAVSQRGIRFREIYASILLRRILSSYPTGYVDLRSPTGAGLGAMVYNYDGDVYSADEGRMLAEMGDITFRLGNVHRDSWESIFRETSLLPTAHATMTEGIPGCCDCAFQPYCGSDPVFHHATQRDAVGHRPSSAFCRRNMEIMRHLIRLLEDDPAAAAVLRTWAA
jgi:His-Xaa-Ser system radical SAM maturase HxsB